MGIRGLAPVAGCLMLLGVAGVAGVAAGAEATATIHRITAEGVGDRVGTVTLADSAYGLRVSPDLHGLQPPGPHGAHVHENPSCTPGDGGAGQTAGGHYDPRGTGRHAGPYGHGHLGDLPNLVVEANGDATIPVLAPRLTAADLTGRALMIHAGADRYGADDAHDHGKGGARMYCGVIE